MNKDQLSGAELIAKERQRQIDVEGWTAEHDDEHADGALALAAVCYAYPAPRPLAIKQLWPWDREWWKPALPDVEDINCGCRSAGDCTHFQVSEDQTGPRIKDLIRAGGLIAAEIDRLQRQATDRR